MATTELQQQHRDRPPEPTVTGRLGPFADALHDRWRRFWRRVSRHMPKRLYARSLIIVIAPMLLLQSVVAFIFLERHWQTVTQRLSQAVVRDIAAVIGRKLNLPVAGKSGEEAAYHFGWMANFAAIDCPASAALTEKRLGWRPSQPGLLADLENGRYFES